MGSSPASKKADGWAYSKYSCPTRRRRENVCTGKYTSDPIVGEFVFNYILNMLNAQNDFSNIDSPEELQRRLLIGNTFGYIDHIDQDGLNDLYNVLLSGVKSDVYAPDISLKDKAPVDSEVSRLRNEKQKVERALDRLRSLYLYSDDAMSEAEYMIEKSKLQDSLDDINEQLGVVSSDEWQQSVSDEVFIQRASNFILAQKLTGRKYVNYKVLAQSVDPEVLKSFVTSVIDSITMYDGKVRQITFRNGLSHTFTFK